MNTKLSFSTLVQDDLLEVENKLRTSIQANFPSLNNALDMIFAAGGKRIRPTMILLLGRMIDAPRDRLITLATAIEMLHTATLVHDDLIDNAILRRGNPTLNTQWSPNATVLTGDLVFGCSARLAAEIENIEAMKLFSQTLIEIVNGELNQMFESRCRISLDDYYKRIYAKTASMFQTGAKSTALIATDNARVIADLGAYGHDIGIAFQIIDDILDFTGEQATVGKPVASDLRQGLVTLPAIIFINDHPGHPDTLPLLEGKCMENEDSIDRLIVDIRNSDAIKQTFQKACEYVQSGIAHLAAFPDVPEKSALIDLANYIINREL